ncbi:PEP-CTERM sorting domain-containing protein [Verrucomicrobiaceae bacterium N1E253]|uniref:PEP-CTERM sorting domain-containing protein n=1 Tax=Oceaniferula marina TaxID=2748318 RepID=A0A851GG89_9BACT|nr:PEP-CTERM sorting domain-containing protein [Oceaniferula marina]NWK55922.1 PEP-CTERM sorting domain-containing protein [Oceaniferula marina]
MKNKALNLLAGLFFASTASLPATLVLFEDFEDSIVNYVQTNAGDSTLIPDNTSELFPDRNYFGIISFADTVGTELNYNNQQGGGFYGAEDTDSTSSGNIDLIQLEWTGVQVAGATGITFSGLFAEDDDFPNEDWDGDSSLVVQAQIDGGGFVDLFAIRSTGGAINSAPSVDTNFDGIGDGTEITDTFTEFSADIDSALGTGSILDLRITISNLNAGDEDIAFDNITVTTSQVPEPSASLLLALAGFSGLARRRRV